MMEEYIEDLILKGTVYKIEPGASPKTITNSFGQPDIETPQHKSYPLIMVYGSIEFRFRKDLLTVVTLDLSESEPRLPKGLDLGSLSNLENRAHEKIERLLSDAQVSWQKDEIMSDDDQLVIITENNVHLAFHDGLLKRVGVYFKY